MKTRVAILLKLTIAILLSVSVWACSSDTKEPMVDPEPENQNPSEETNTPDPLSASLIFPTDNKECNEGNSIDEEQTIVDFSWNPAENTDFYTIFVENLITNSVSETVSNATTTPITLLRGTPYEWYVVSSSNASDAKAESEKWRFYNQGVSVQNYAPFPAETIYPQDGGFTSITAVALEWSASDIDDDIKEYEVFLAKGNEDQDSLGVLENTRLEVVIETGFQYYWQVKVTDLAGNSSLSPIWSFSY